MIRYEMAVGLHKGHKVTKMIEGRKNKPSRRKGVCIVLFAMYVFRGYWCHQYKLTWWWLQCLLNIKAFKHNKEQALLKLVTLDEVFTNFFLGNRLT